MKLNTKQLILIVLGILVISQGENIRKSIEKNALREEAKTTKKERIRKDKDKVNELEDLSKIAVSRADSCIEITDIKTGKPFELSPTTKVYNSSRTDELREGAPVCSGTDTAIVTKEGLTSIARVNKTDEQIYYKIRGKN